ncbi:hypothetical protein MKFW12EY_43740 (plasmid) [Methylomonas koyamae]|nr:hypothetical protein MKFW12EY_43740 [Methylomonas koyamae]
MIQGSGRKSLKEGQRVAMEVTSRPKGPQAENVTPLYLSKQWLSKARNQILTKLSFLL